MTSQPVEPGASTSPNPWKTHSSTVVYDNPWIQVTHREVTTPTGTDGIYGVAHFKNLAIGVVPIDDEDFTWLVGQYRYPLDEYSWEIPAGGGPVGTDPVDAARRELHEECGIHAEHFEKILESTLSNSVTDERAVIFVATGLEYGEPDPDPTEDLQLRRLPLDQAIDLVVRGEITDSLSQLALMRIALRRSAT